MTTPNNTLENNPAEIGQPREERDADGKRAGNASVQAADAAAPDAPRRQSTGGKRIAAVVAAFAVGVIGTAAVMSHKGPVLPQQAAQDDKPMVDSDQKAQQDGPQLIKIAPAAVRTARIRSEAARTSLRGSTMTVPGSVMTSPDQAARITPPVSGKVVRILVNLGDRVRAGQSLAVLDSVDVAQAHAAVRQAETSVVQAVAAVNTAEAQVQEAQGKQAAAGATLGRQRQLAQAGAFSQAPLAAAQSDLSQAQAELAQAQTELQTRVSAEARAGRLFQTQIVSRADLEQAQANLRQSQARTDQATTRVSLAKQALTREQKVYGGGLLDKQAIQSAQADTRSTQAQTQTAIRQKEAAAAALSAAKSAVVTARANLASLEGDRHTTGGAGMVVLRTPISGVVTDRQATMGEAVERSTSLFLIENLSAVIVNANVPEAQIGQVRLGQQAEVTVSAYPDKRLRGVVQSLASHVDEKTRALAVRVLVENGGGHLRPDMFARVALGVGVPSRRIVVPAAAVDEDGPDRFVYVQQARGFEKRKVQVGLTTQDSTVIREGLKPGEQVVIDGVFILKSESKKDELKGDD